MEPVLQATSAKKSEIYGGTGGDPFDDNLTAVKKLLAIHIKHGVRVDSILCVWEETDGTQVSGNRHGGSDGDHETIIVLREDEKIVKAIVGSGDVVNRITFITDQKRTFGPYGWEGGTEKEVTLGDGLLGFFGRAAHVIDAIGFFYE